MKNLKKSLAILLAAVMLFSTFAFVTAYADDDNDGRATVNVKVNAPVVGEKADETIIVEDERFVPGYADMLLLDDDPEDFYKNFGKMPTSEEVVNNMMKMELDESANSQDKKFREAQTASIGRMIMKGIVWIEYDINDFNKMVDAGAITQDELDALLKDYSKWDLIEILLQSSEEYGGSFGESYKGISSTARFMKPGDTFKEGKSYMCCLQASVDIKKEIEDMVTAGNALMPCYERKSEINKKLETATDEEATELNSQLETLEAAISEKSDNYYAYYGAARSKIISINGENYGMPVLTVNGEKTEENMKGMWAAYYDFGEAEKAPEEPTFIERVIAFFNSIIDFFRNLFSFINF